MWLASYIRRLENIARCDPHGEKTKSDGACNATCIVRRQSLLVLTRKLDQSIVVSCDEVEVRFKIIRCGRDKVSVGIEAPPGVKILRAELQAERPAA
jgi:carbon storage regulator CsrA